MGWAASAAATRSGGTVSPYGASMVWTVRPNARAMPVQRSPNLPHWTTSTSSPGEQRLTTAASSAPVPEAARIMTSLRVPIELGETGPHAPEERLELGRAVMEDRLSDRLEDLGGDRGRTRREQVVLLHGLAP